MKLLHKLPVPFLRIWNHHSDSEKNSLPGYISPEQLIFLKKYAITVSSYSPHVFFF